MATEAQLAFISYSREDDEFALKLAEDLKAAGAAVWLDQLDIAPGQRWAKAVQDALNDCPRMLVILSPASANSTNVEDEFSFALEEKKTVIPVLYRDCKVPFRLRPLQYVDFRGDYARGLGRLLQTLAGGSPPAQAAPALREAVPAAPREAPIEAGAKLPKAKHEHAQEQPRPAQKQAVPVAPVAKQARGAITGTDIWGLTAEPDRGENKPVRRGGYGRFAAFLLFLWWSRPWVRIAAALCAIAVVALIAYWAFVGSRNGGERQGGGAGEGGSSASNAKILSSPSVSSTSEGSWRDRTSGISEALGANSNLHSSDLFSVTFATPQLGWAVGRDRILHTEDGGTTWMSQSAGLSDIIELPDVAFATRVSGWAVGLRGNAQHTDGLILHTEDGGNTWKQQSSGTHVTLFSVASPAPQSAWAVGADGVILHTADGGNTWKQQSSGTTELLISVNFPAPQSGWVVGTHGIILHTGDGGNTWEAQRSGAVNANLESVTFPTPQSGWVVGTDGVILHTEDGGLSWSRQNSGTKENLRSVAFHTPLSGWAVGLKGIVLHTEDGGNTWKEQVSGTGLGLYSVAFPTARSGWAVGERGTILHWKND